MVHEFQFVGGFIAVLKDKAELQPDVAPLLIRAADLRGTPSWWAVTKGNLTAHLFAARELGK